MLKFFLAKFYDEDHFRDLIQVFQKKQEKRH